MKTAEEKRQALKQQQYSLRVNGLKTVGEAAGYQAQEDWQAPFTFMEGYTKNIVDTQMLPRLQAMHDKAVELGHDDHNVFDWNDLDNAIWYTPIKPNKYNDTGRNLLHLTEQNANYLLYWCNDFHATISGETQAKLYIFRAYRQCQCYYIHGQKPRTLTAMTKMLSEADMAGHCIVDSKGKNFYWDYRDNETILSPKFKGYEVGMLGMYMFPQVYREVLWAHDAYINEE